MSCVFALDTGHLTLPIGRKTFCGINFETPPDKCPMSLAGTPVILLNPRSFDQWPTIRAFTDIGLSNNVFWKKNRERRFIFTPQKGVFGYFGTPPSVFEVEWWNFQNVLPYPCLKKCWEQNLGFGPRLGSAGPPKRVKILKFLFFKIEASNFYRMLIFRPWYHICWKILVWGPESSPHPKKGKNSHWLRPHGAKTFFRMR